MATKPMLSVIVPTYNERENMRPLIRGLTQALDAEAIPHEIIVMDDNSPDKTAQEVDTLVSEGFKRVRVVVRRTNRGLSPAVIDGYAEAKGAVWLVMDADLSHPIEVVPRLYRRIVEGGADVAVGSRHVPGGGIERWPVHRRIVSWGAAALARPLTACTDPMSGFFAIKPDVIKNAKLNAAGFKILLEVLVKGNYKSMQEEPITFRDRISGESKLTRGVIISYLMHLARLYMTPGSAPLLQFLFVGATGAVIDLGLFSLLHRFISRRVVAQSVSFFTAVAWNFNWNKRWSFARQRQQAAAPKQFLKFVVTSAVAYVLRTLLFEGLCKLTGIDTFPGLQIILLAVITMVTVVNFLGSKLWAFA